MQIIPQYNDLKPYLEADEIIDINSKEIIELSSNISTYSKNEIEYIKNAYEFVRDKISHSADIQGKVVTCKASDVLRTGEGICFAKSHLLAAILRCHLIPTGFCYQRLILDDNTEPQIILHGLNAVYIESLGKWIRLDARGNKVGVNAQFSLEREKLAFPVRTEKGEEDIPIIYANPDKNVLAALTKNKDLSVLWANLPTTLSV